MILSAISSFLLCVLCVLRVNLPSASPRMPAMPDAQPFRLAIETSGRESSLCVGLGTAVLHSITLADQPGAPTRGSLLMPAIDSLCKQAGAEPSSLAEVFISIGPGSFTGLRVAVAIARGLAQTLGTRLVAVPSLEVLACNGPADARHIAVALNLKRDTMYCAAYQRAGKALVALCPPALRTLPELLAQMPRPAVLMGDPLPAMPEPCPGVTVLDASYAVGRAQAVYELGCSMALRGQFTDLYALTPLYVRPPEAVELWNQKHGVDFSSQRA